MNSPTRHPEKMCRGQYTPSARFGSRIIRKSRNLHFGTALLAQRQVPHRTQTGLKNDMATDVSGDGSGSKSAASAIIERKASTVDKHKTNDGPGSRPGEPEKAEHSKPMGKDFSGAEPGSRPVDSRVARRRQDPLGRRLRQMYDEVVREDVPEDFLSFLEKADERLTRGKGDADAEAEDPGNKSKS
jgi:hypothetical protein